MEDRFEEVEVMCTQSSTKYALGIKADVHSSAASRGGRLPKFRKPY